MVIQRETFGGFSNCVVLYNAGLKLIATTEVGPRILFFGRESGPNHLLVRQEHAGLKGGEYRSYGGHRLWIGPEERPRTYTSDSFPVEVAIRADEVVLASCVDEFQVHRILTIAPTPEGFRIEHRFANHGTSPISGALWAITVMEPGGECVVPMHPVVPQAAGLLPVQPIVLWGYASMADVRYTWGRRVARLRSTEEPEPTKFGSYVTQGVAAYSNFGATFVKRFSVQPFDNPHIDMGCNFESYTKKGMLEVESLGIHQTVGGGEVSDPHTEEWTIRPGLVPDEDEAAGNWFDQVTTEAFRGR